MGMTPSHQKALSAESPRSVISWSAKALALGSVALAVYASSIRAQPFEDEYAYITQSYYADLFLRGAVDHPAWLDFFAYDVQPLPKYLVGLSLRWANLPRPDAEAARNWYLNYARFGTSDTLTAARWPILVLGALGCVAIFGCGTLVKDSRLGAIAAVLVMLNPLYSLHAHRAMSDVPCEAFVAIALGLALLSWKSAFSARGAVAVMVISGLSGIAAGLALLCKFNAFVALLIVACWTMIGLLAPGIHWPRRLLIVSGSATTLAATIVVFVALNPFMTARPKGPVPPEARQIVDANPWQRLLFQVRHRVKLSEYQQKTFPHDALRSLADRSAVVAVQGFGRFGLFGPAMSDSTARFDLKQDWAAVLWTPLVLIGMAASISLGQRQWRAAEPPTGIALLTWAATTWMVVTVYIPMAWDRYLLPIQGVNALLAALGASMIWDRFARVVSSSRARA